MTYLDSILKSRDITLPTKVPLVKAMVFPVVMYRCKSCTIKKAEGWKIDAFKLWCWRRLLRVPWTARRPNQSILKEISPEYSLERLMLKLKLQYFGHLIQRTDLLEKPWYWERLKAGGEGDDRGWDGWMASLTQWIWVWINSGSWWWTGKLGMLQSMGQQSCARLSDWTDIIYYDKNITIDFFFLKCLYQVLYVSKAFSGFVMIIIYVLILYTILVSNICIYLLLLLLLLLSVMYYYH